MRQEPRAMLRAMISIPEGADPAVRRWWLDLAAMAGHVLPMPNIDRVYRVELDQVGPTEGWYTLAGHRRGPFTSPEAMEADLLEVLAAWRARARQLGGWAWRRTATEFVVTLPDSVVVEGGDPLTPWVRPG